MDSKFKRTLVTAALPYANGPVHIGHLAGCYLPADIYVRYLRSIGSDVKFICGSDEHGVPITIKAKKEHTTPQAIVGSARSSSASARQQWKSSSAGPRASSKGLPSAASCAPVTVSASPLTHAHRAYKNFPARCQPAFLLHQALL